VAALTWWNFSDDGAWLGAPSGLVQNDMSPKPAYERLHKMIKGEWGTGELKLKADAAGVGRFRGCLGCYAAEHGGLSTALSVPGPVALALTVRLGTAAKPSAR